MLQRKQDIVGTQERTTVHIRKPGKHKIYIQRLQREQEKVQIDRKNEVEEKARESLNI